MTPSKKVPAVLERPELLLVPAGVSLGAAVARVQPGAPGVECRLEPERGRGFGLRETADGRLWLVTTARLHRERRHEYELRLQISQLLSLLHQGQFQARPNFRGNKYLKNRTTVPEADRESLKDSGQGESEEGDSDSDTGQISPIEQLLEEGLNDLLARSSWTAPKGTGPRESEREQLRLEELCWSLPSPLCCDYRENMFNPRSSDESEVVETTENTEKTTFSTFGKGGSQGSEEPSARGSLLNEMSALFQNLLVQKAEAFGQPETQLLGKLSARWSVLCEGEVGTTGGRFLPSLLETPEQSTGLQPPQQLDK
ncbi:protocadherin-18 isoform X2 [Narcine bancroftii]|uniref:protocadherin-18 isoform X2 n=1 Tax=Narcine bancroftii TaxID=1343680 RepID=UPI003831ABDE